MEADAAASAAARGISGTGIVGSSVALDVSAPDPRRDHFGRSSVTDRKRRAGAFVDPVDLRRIVSSCGNDRIPVHRGGHSSPCRGPSRSLRLDSHSPRSLGAPHWHQSSRRATSHGSFCPTSPGSSSTSTSRTSAWWRWRRPLPGSVVRPVRNAERCRRRPCSGSWRSWPIRACSNSAIRLLCVGSTVVALLGFICAVVWGVALVLGRPRSQRNIGVTATYLMALLFFAPVFVFRSPYAAVGGMTIGHGLQYLLLVGLVAAGRSRGKSRARRLGSSLQSRPAGRSPLERGLAPARCAGAGSSALRGLPRGGDGSLRD